MLHQPHTLNYNEQIIKEYIPQNNTKAMLHFTFSHHIRNVGEYPIDL